MLLKPTNNIRFSDQEIQDDVKATIEQLFPHDFQAFRQVPMTAQTFGLLMALAEYSYPQAIVLWDLLIFHRCTNKLDRYQEISLRDYAKQYGQATGATYGNLIERLISQQLINRQLQVRNVSMQLQVNWDNLVLSMRELDVDTFIPGVTFCYFAVAGSTAF